VNDGPEHMGGLGPPLREFLQARGWADACAALERHPELCSEQVERYLKGLADGAEGALARALLYQRLNLLRSCRRAGVRSVAARLDRLTAPERGRAAADAVLDEVRRGYLAAARYGASGDAAALDEALASFELVLAHPKFAELPAGLKAEAYRQCGIGRLERHGRHAEVGDLDVAAEALERAAVEALAARSSGAAGAPAGSPPPAPLPASLLADVARALTSAGLKLWERSARTAASEDLDAAVRAFRRALELASFGESNGAEAAAARALLLNNLGAALAERHERRGDVADLAEAVTVFERAVAAASPEDRPRYERNLAHARAALAAVRRAREDRPPR